MNQIFSQITLRWKFFFYFVLKSSRVMLKNAPFGVETLTLVSNSWSASESSLLTLETQNKMNMGLLLVLADWEKREKNLESFQVFVMAVEPLLLLMLWNIFYKI